MEWEGWQFDLLGNKRFRLRPKLCGCRVVACKCSKASWMYICDVGGFWQSSFLSVIDPKRWGNSPVCSTEEFLEIKRGKSDRSDAVLDDNMRRYNRLENVVLSRAMERLNIGFESLGIHLSPRQWFGPGQGAQEWLKENLPKSREYLKDVPDWFLGAARDSYFGGWFEIMAHGIVKGTTHEYDINSAYPSIIARLPCLLHGRYTRGVGRLPELAQKDLLLVRTRLRTCSPTAFDRDKRYYIGAALHRDASGNISRPILTQGWYWWSEILASNAAKCCRLPGESDIKEWVHYAPCDCDPPLAGMAFLYEHRLSVGKDTPEGMACKLLYNSGYGKFAQSVGHPAFGNPIYASLITSGCREMILRAIATHPGGKRSVLMVATDAVFFDQPHPTLPVTDKLGDWGYKERVDLCLFKPGVYWDDSTRKVLAKGESASFKARGVSAREFGKHLSEVERGFKGWDGLLPLLDNGQTGLREARERMVWPAVEFNPGFTMVTALQALRRHRWDIAGKRKDHVDPDKPLTVTQDSWYGKKRERIYWDGKIWRSEPHGPRWSEQLGDFDCASHPYRKSFGLDDPFSEETEEEWGVNEDGPVRQSFRELIRSGRD